MCLGRSSYLIKHLKELGTGLVNSADDCPTSLSQRLHEGNDLEAGRAVQAAGGRRAHVHCWIETRQRLILLKRRITPNPFTEQFLVQETNYS